MRKRADKGRGRRKSCAILTCHSSHTEIAFYGFPVCLFPGRKKHVTLVSDPLAGLSPGSAGHPTARPAHQSQRSRAHRRGGAHVHEQLGHAHQVPWLQVSLFSFALLDHLDHPASLCRYSILCMFLKPSPILDGEINNRCIITLLYGTKTWIKHTV